MAYQFGDTEILVDKISEKTPNAGVEVDGVLIKDGEVDGRDVSADGSKLDTVESGAEVNNISDENATDLTDSGATTLHKHDHGNMDGLGDDDHTIYALLDGSRAFSAVISGVTPTESTHLATKGYVDSLIQGLDWQDSVVDKDLTAPPVSPSEGDRYIVASGATGDWAGKDGYIAVYNGSGWDFELPNEGFATWVEDENLLYVYNGSSWVKFGSTVDHGNLLGLSDDDHAQYALLAGRAGGQSLIGGNASGNNLTLQSTSHATKGKIILGSSSAYDEVNDRLGLGITSPSYRQHFYQSATGEVIMAFLQNPHGATNDAVAIAMNITSSGTIMAKMAAIRTNAIASADTDFVWYLYQSSLAEKMRLSAIGDLTIANRLKQLGCFAEIYVESGSTAQTIPTGATYTKLNAFVSNGESANCTPDASNDKITITKTGKYKVSCPVSFYGDIEKWYVAVFLNGVEQSNVHFSRSITNATDVGNATLSGYIDVTTANLDLDIRVRHDNGASKDITIEYANLSVRYMGET